MSKITIEISYDLNRADLSKKLVEVIKPEISSASEKFSRSSIQIKSLNNKFISEITATDYTAAKASFNSLMSWINTTLEIFNTYSKKED